MAKKQTDSGPRELTRKERAFSKREQEQLNKLYTGLGISGGLVILALILGALYTYIYIPNSAIAIVNKEKITIDQYHKRVQYERFILEDQYRQIAAERAKVVESENEQLAGLYEQWSNQILQQRQLVDQQTLDIMIGDKLIETEASKRSITVSDQEVTEQINRLLAGRLGGLTTAEASETATARAEASQTAALWTPTPTFTPSPTKIITSTKNVSPTETPANTAIPGPTPTLNVIAAADLGTQYTNWINTLAENTGITAVEYRQFIRANIFRDKLGKIIGDEAPKSAEQAQARHILVKTEEEAKKIIKRLEGGEKFAKLAEELSEDPGSKMEGGDLGFVPHGRFVEPIDKAIFSMPIGEIKAVQSSFGWHVLEVLVRENRLLSPEDYNQSKRTTFNDWLEKSRKESTIENYWSIDKLPRDKFLTQGAG